MYFFCRNLPRLDGRINTCRLTGIVAILDSQRAPFGLSLFKMGAWAELESQADILDIPAPTFSKVFWVLGNT